MQCCHTGPRLKNNVRLFDDRNAITMDDEPFVFSYTDWRLSPKSDDSSSFDDDDESIVYENDHENDRNAGGEAAAAAAVELAPQPISFLFRHTDATRQTTEVRIIISQPVAVLLGASGAQAPKSCSAPQFFQGNLGLTCLHQFILYYTI